MFLSIVAAFCDKDAQYIPELLNTIKERVHVSHEVILIDNRENNKDEIDFQNAKVYSKGYNAYQFEARRYSVQFCKGDYIWFIDADDEVLTVESDLEDILKEDLIVFEYTNKLNIITLPYQHYILKDIFNRNRFNVTTKEDILKLKPVDCYYDLFTCTFWNKWVKREMMLDIVKDLPENEIIVASEDVLYSALVIDRSKSVNFCYDLIYLYMQERSVADPDKMTLDRFKHIIRGRNKATALFKKLIPDYKMYLNEYTGCAYFYTKLAHCEEIEEGFNEMINHFEPKILKLSVKHLWFKRINDDKQKAIKEAIKKYL